MSKKLGEIWLRLGHEAVKKALAESDGKITPEVQKNIRATLEGHLEKDGVALKYVSQNLSYHAEAWSKMALKEFAPRNKPLRADCTDEEWTEIQERTWLKNSIKADNKLKREILVAKAEAEIVKAVDLNPGETMDEASRIARDLPSRIS